MTLNKALRTDESSETDELEIKQAHLLRNLFKNSNLLNTSLHQAKGRIKQLLSKMSLNNESAPSPTNFDRRREK